MRFTYKMYKCVVDRTHATNVLGKNYLVSDIRI